MKANCARRMAHTQPPGPSAIVIHIQLRTSYSDGTWHSVPEHHAPPSSQYLLFTPKGLPVYPLAAQSRHTPLSFVLLAPLSNPNSTSQLAALCHIHFCSPWHSHSSMWFHSQLIDCSAGALGEACLVISWHVAQQHLLFSILNFFLCHVIGTSSNSSSLQAEGWAAHGWYCQSLGSFGHSHIPIHLVLLPNNIAQCYASPNATHTLPRIRSLLCDTIIAFYVLYISAAVSIRLIIVRY